MRSGRHAKWSQASCRTSSTAPDACARMSLSTCFRCIGAILVDGPSIIHVKYDQKKARPCCGVRYVFVENMEVMRIISHSTLSQLPNKRTISSLPQNLIPNSLRIYKTQSSIQMTSRDPDCLDIITTGSSLYHKWWDGSNGVLPSTLRRTKTPASPGAQTVSTSSSPVRIAPSFINGGTARPGGLSVTEYERLGGTAVGIIHRCVSRYAAERI